MTKYNVNPGTRFVSLSQNAVLVAAAEFNGGIIYIDEPTADYGQVIDALGAILPDEYLAEHGFQQVLEIAPYPDGAVLVRVDGKLVAGQVIAVSSNLITYTHVVSLQDRTPETGARALANRDDVYVVYPVPRLGTPLLHEDQVVVVINPARAEFGQIVSVNSLTALRPGNVQIETLDGTTLEVRQFEVEPYVQPKFGTLSVLDLTPMGKGEEALPGAGVVVDSPSSTIEAASAAIKSNALFGVDFVPANVSVPQKDGEDYNPIGDCFSFDELAVIVSLGEVDAEFAATMLSITILDGRQIDEKVLRMMLGEGIPYGFSQFIPNATEFFRQVGEVAKAQTEEKLKKAATGDMSVFADGAYADPTEIVFARITGFDMDASAGIINRELDADDVQDLTDEYARRAAEGYKPEPEVATDDTDEAIAMLDAQFGAGNYKLLTAEEAVEAFGIDALQAIADGGVFGEVINPDQFAGFDQLLTAVMGDSDAGLKDFLKGPKPTAFADAHIDIDECLMEFQALAEAGRFDSNLVHGTLTETSNLLDIAIGDALTDIAKGQKLIEAGLASLRQANEFARILPSQVNNVLPLADAFDALDTDVINLQSARSL